MRISLPELQIHQSDSTSMNGCEQEDNANMSTAMLVEQSLNALQRVVSCGLELFG